MGQGGSQRFCHNIGITQAALSDALKAPEQVASRITTARRIVHSSGEVNMYSDKTGHARTATYAASDTAFLALNQRWKYNGEFGRTVHAFT
jgi:hypothetical protein